MNTFKKSKLYCDAYILEFGPEKTNGSQENLYFSIKSLLFKSWVFFFNYPPLIKGYFSRYSCFKPWAKVFKEYFGYKFYTQTCVKHLMAISELYLRCVNKA